MSGDTKELAREKVPTGNAETRLLDSALALFSEKGYESTSIREIIEGAGVTRPVLYYYFVNKEDLYHRLVDTSFSEIAAQFERIAAQDASCEARLIDFMKSAFDYVETRPASIRLILQVFFAPPKQGPRLDKNRLWALRFRPLVAVMEQGLQNGELSHGDAASMAWAFCGIMDIHIMTKTNLPDAPLSPELAEGLVSVFLAGARGDAPESVQLRSPFRLE